MPWHRHLWYLPPVPFQEKLPVCLPGSRSLSADLYTTWLQHGKVLPTPFKYGKGDNLAVL